MAALKLKLEIPDSLAQEAKAAGLLRPQAIARLLREEIRRRRAKRFFEIADRLADLGIPRMTDAEIEAEIQAVRRARGANRASGR